MRRFGTTGIIVVVFLLLLGYVYFTETEEPVEVVHTMIYDLDTEEVTSIALASQDEEFILSREKKEWVITKPRVLKVDQSVVQEIVKTLSSLEAVDAIADRKDSLEEYGLDSPELIIEINTEHGPIETLSVGTETPVLGGYYARKSDSDAIYVINGYAVNRFARKLSDVRDRTIVSFDTNEVSRVELSMDVGEVILVKQPDGTWKMQSPYSEPVDTDKIYDILYDLKDIRVSEFVADDPSIEYIRECGIDTPTLVARLTTCKSSGEQQCSVIIGKRTAVGELYVASDSSNSIYKVYAPGLDLLSLELIDIVDKRLVMFDSSQIRTLSYDAKDSSVGIHQKSGKWYLGDYVLDDTNVRSLLYLVEGIQIHDVAVGKIDMPAITLRLEFDSSVLEILVGDESENTVYVATSERTGTYLVEKDILEQILSKLEQLQKMP